MYYLATYDQLNCPCLAGVEVMAQRLAQLIDAYASGDASRPNFKGVRHFTSEVSSTCVVPVALRTFAHRKAEEEHDMEKLRLHGTGSHGPHSGASGGMLMMKEALRLGRLHGRGAHRRPKVQERPVEVQRLSRQGWRLPPALANEFFRGWRFGVDRQSTVGRPRHAAC